MSLKKCGRLKVKYGPKKPHRHASWMFTSKSGDAIIHYPPNEDTLNDNSLYIEDFRVKPAYRSKGCGRLMEKQIEQFGKKIGADYIELNTVPQAIDFWHKIGFRLAEEPVEGLRPIMTKKIGKQPRF